MKKPEHLALPLNILIHQGDFDDNDTYAEFGIVDSHNDPDDEAACDYERYAHFDDIEIAKYFYHCVNSHDKLVEALEKSLAIIKEGKRKFTPKTTNSQVDYFIIELERLLARGDDQKPQTEGVE